MSAPNVLFITLDQFRGDALSLVGHPVVRTPHLDRLAARGVHFAKHYAQAAPCAPGRASLYTGTYQMRHRVLGNGTPLDDRFDNVARVARRAGRIPVLFGYTDQAVDPRLTASGDDPRLWTYEGILAGFEAGLHLPTHHEPWRRWLVSQGHEDPGSGLAALATEAERPAEHGVSAFLTDRIIEYLRGATSPWFVHASYLRPHPPRSAAGHWSTAYDPREVGEPVPVSTWRHPFHDFALGLDAVAAPSDPMQLREERAQYFGMISAVDEQLGRLWDALEEIGAAEDTVVVVTADHGEQLGDHGLMEKLGFFESSYHVPAIVADPRRPGGHARRVDAFTENVDILPTLAEILDVEVPHQCDGYPLTPWLEGADPGVWRDAAHWEYDWSALVLQATGQVPAWPWDRRDAAWNLAVTRTEDAAYVQFADGTWLAFDLASDPTWRTPLEDQQAVFGLARRQLVWRQTHGERTLTGLVLEHGGVGRWPAGVAWRDDGTG